MGKDSYIKMFIIYTHTYTTRQWISQYLLKCSSLKYGFLELHKPGSSHLLHAFIGTVNKNVNKKSNYLEGKKMYYKDIEYLTEH